MIVEPLHAGGIDDLRSLVDARTRESRTLEYKLELPGGTDAEKKEFLADVSSLANASGGDLIFGIREEDGEAAEVVGLGGLDRDAEPLRLEHLIRDGIEPRIPGVHTHIVDGGREGPVLIMRVPRSWAGPHMVVYKARSQFFSRSTNGKFPMDTSEIRAAFEGAADISKQIRAWRDQRLGLVVANEGPVRLLPTACLVFHVVPLDSFRDEWRFAAEELNDSEIRISPLGAGGWDNRINVDGFMSFASDPDDAGKVHSYVQMFRSGRIEAVTSRLLRERDGVKLIASIWYEKEVIGSVQDYLALIKKLGVEPPLVFCLSLVGAKGAYMAADSFFSKMNAAPIDRNLITLPEVLIEDYGCDLKRTLRPAFDAVWNACGFPRSMNYDNDGNWNPR